MGSKLNFLREFISQPDSIGAVTPSGKALASRMLDGISLEKSSVIVELGPGTGAFTAEVLKRISPDSRFLAIEKNPTFVRDLVEHFNEVEIIEGNASELVSILHEKGIEQVDTVVSGLPWASFPDQLQEEILSEVSRSLSSGGRFVTFAYGGIHLFPKARAFRQRLDKLFQDVERTPIAWRNLPPAFAYHCRR
ncbi:MAG: methyltransferase domain-containing protein [Planctomycetota bacterium]|nr:methyltransferase domain-containing protein [Planctomycetota bacterium]